MGKVKDTKEILGRNSGGWLDLTEPEQREELRRHLGGEEFREKFPLFFSALDKAGMQVKSDQPVDGVKSTPGNTVMVDYLIYSPKSRTLSAHVLGFFPDYVTGTGQMQVKGQDGSILEQNTISIKNERFISSQFSWENFDLKPHLNEMLSAWFEVVTVNGKGALESGTFQYQIEGCELASTIVDHIQVSDPIHKDDPDHQVVVLLARRWSNVLAQSSFYDYDYQNVSRLLPGQRDNVFLDFSGSAVFSDSSKVFKGFKEDTCDFRLYSDREFVDYDMENYEDFLRHCFQKREGGFQWNLNYAASDPGEPPEKKKLENINWHKLLPTAFLNADVNFYFHGHFIYGTEGDPSSDEESCFLLSSTLSEDENYKKKMPHICFYVGCLGPDTQVSMADGTKKAIHRVKQGEPVKAPGNKTAYVKDLVTGKEDKDLFGLRVNGQEGYTVITGSHVLRTRRGQLPVSRLGMDDELLAEDGSWHLLEELFPVKGGDIYNLLLEEPGEFYADGLCVGDYGVQNTYIYREPKPEVSVELLKEAEALACYLQEKGEAHGKVQ